MSRVAELAKVLNDKVSKMQDFAQKGIEINGVEVKVTSDAAAEYKKLYKQATEIKELIDIEQFGIRQKEWVAQLDEAGPSAAMGAMSGVPARMLSKSLGELFTGSEEFKEFAHRLGPQVSGKATMDRTFDHEQFDIVRNVGMPYGGMQQKDIYGNLDSGTITRGIGTVIQFDPMIPRQQRPNRVRDLFPQASTTANLIDYFQVLGFAENGGDGNAQTVPDRDANNTGFGLKPQSTLRFQPQQAPVRTIAHWEAAHRNVIMDVPQLQATINNELLYGLALVEDFQLLQGDGTVENIKGILNHEGIQIYTAPDNELKSDSLRRASTLTMLANYPPNGYVLHPNDWEDVELQKGSGDGQYMLFTNIAVGVNAQVWRQPVVETAAMPEGTFLNGAFGAGAQVYDRMRASIRIAEQHADFFVRNAVVILCEERLALAVKRPEAFVKGAFDQ